jgi:hypothetical protein
VHSLNYLFILNCKIALSTNTELTITVTKRQFEAFLFSLILIMLSSNKFYSKDSAFNGIFFYDGDVSENYLFYNVACCIYHYSVVTDDLLILFIFFPSEMDLLIVEEICQRLWKLWASIQHQEDHRMLQ